MFRILDKNGATIETQDRIKYVKMQGNGFICLCSKDEADGIVANDDLTFYALKGRLMELMGGYEVVTIEEYIADNTIINTLADNSDLMDSIASDLTYLTVMQELAES